MTPCLHLHLDKIKPSGAELLDTNLFFRVRCANPECKKMFSVKPFVIAVTYPEPEKSPAD